MPTSNDTLVRVDDLLKSMAQVWPDSGLACEARSRLNTAARCRTVLMSPGDIFSRLNRCFISTPSRSRGKGREKHKKRGTLKRISGPALPGMAERGLRAAFAFWCRK